MEQITASIKSYSKNKIIGMVMILISMGSLFYQTYKIIFPYFYFLQENKALSNLPEVDAQTLAYQQKILDQINGITGLDIKDSTALILFGGIGFIGIIIYLIGGIKLRGKTNIKNYKTAKFCILFFLIYNISGVIYFFDRNPGIYLEIVFGMAIVGIIIDGILLISIKKQIKVLNTDPNELNRKIYFSD